MTTPDHSIWHEAYKIPWDEAAFSRRMLAEHLSQDHDLASRRTEWIDRQVAWIDDDPLGARPADILDLGCGPGLYSHRLAKRGHRCRGIDFGPASIEYARRHSPDASHCTFVLGDLRRVAFGGPFDLAMVLFGELNAFSPAEAAAILRKARASLRSGGRLIAEVQTPQAVERVGRGGPGEQQFASGLFSDRPHRCRTENEWLGEPKVAIQTFTVTELGGGRPTVYHSTAQAWPDDDLIALLTDAGFDDARRRDDWPCNTDDLALWLAGRR